MKTGIHKAQVNILTLLRHNSSNKFSELLKITDLDGDVFKFHLKKLCLLRYVEKISVGNYVLTSIGKEFANSIDREDQSVRKQPKLSILIVAERTNKLGKKEYLLQKRHRNPYLNYWGFIGGPIYWSEDAEDAAKRELLKQTGLNANFEVRSFYRKKDTLRGTDILLEDKLFIILKAIYVEGRLLNTWHGGHNEWLTLTDLELHEKFFDTTIEMIDMIAGNVFFNSNTSSYEQNNY